ncbi:uncharacterized protein LOC130740564 [Lotus japonicus]|uniref:uncharacterized protein LOC130740564 n=1 Tax=Lotus japonicus TaxID=34305 RepID=UPI00258CC053|nr:uncharacterized protein LOC130740564 [Lotus japonicus]
MLKERDSLWYKILKTKYNDMVPSTTSCWWKDLHSLCFEEGGGQWIEGGLCRKIGEGNEVNFWHVNWLSSGILKEKFWRLFNLSVQQNYTVKEMGRWSNGSWIWELLWQRPFLHREVDMMDELMNIIANHSLTEGTPDSWVWTKEEGGSYSVKSAYDLLQRDVLEPLDKVYQNLCSIKAPSNVMCLAWKVLLNRIQSKENLKRKGIIQDTSQTTCPFCLAAVESTSHLFFTCPKSWQVWISVYRRLGISVVSPEEGRAHMLMFLDSCCARDRKSGMSFI